MDIYVKRGRLSYPSADGEPLPERVEVAVIGGGMTGVLTALMLRMRGLDAVVLEAEEIGRGGTGSCLGALGLGDGIQMGQIEAASGTTAALTYARYMQATCDAYTALSAHYRLRAEVERRSAVLYTQRWEASLESEAAVAERLGICHELARRSELPFPIRRSLIYPRQGMLDPLMFLYGLARQVKLFAGVRILEVHGNTLLTDEGDMIEAQKIVYACRTPSARMTDGDMPQLLYCHAHALVMAHVPPLSCLYTGFDYDGVRMLSRGKLMLAASTPTVIRHDRSLRERLMGYYPAARVTETWALWDTMAPDELPLIGSIAPHKYIATGYGGRGLSYAMIAAEMLTGEICGEGHPLREVFSPAREMTRVAMARTVARLT